MGKGIVYKICAVRNDRYYSAFVPKEIGCEYILNEWTEPEVGMLFAFKDIKYATKFHSKDIPPVVLFKCEARNVLSVKRLPVKRKIIYYPYNMEQLRTYWKCDTYSGQAVFPPPTGTVLCDAVFPTELLSPFPKADKKRRTYVSL